MGYLVDIAKTVPITIGDYDFCKKDIKTGKRKNTGWHNIKYDDKWNIVENDIKICKWLNKKELITTAKHELWHQAYFTKMDDNDRTKWDGLNYKSSKLLDFLQKYSTTNKIEDFADTFWNSFSKKPAKRSPVYDEKIKFINNIKKR